MYNFLQTSNFASEYISILMLIACAILILSAFRIIGLMGLHLFNAVAIIASNIQVLQVTDFGLFKDPMALGTVTFAMIALVSDIITEHYGKNEAKKTILICFFAQISFAVMMLISSLYKPAHGFENISSAIDLLFIPSWRILTASIIAYMVGQYFDISVFGWLKSKTKNNFLWLRTSVSTIFSGFIDNFIFSYIAWVLLSPNPIDLKSLFTIYIIAAYLGRVMVNIASVPIIYLSYFFKKSSV
jgi:uncharacterized integral membrane protein (TIGR00697 family)